MSEIIEPLTADEETVLSIAAQGQSMVPIGRWTVPILMLWKRKFLFKHDDFNYTITHGGQAALEAHQKATEAELRSAIDKYKNAQAEKASADRTAIEKDFDNGSDRT